MKYILASDMDDMMENINDYDYSDLEELDDGLEDNDDISIHCAFELVDFINERDYAFSLQLFNKDKFIMNFNRNCSMINIGITNEYFKEDNIPKEIKIIVRNATDEYLFFDLNIFELNKEFVYHSYSFRYLNQECYNILARVYPNKISIDILEEVFKSIPRGAHIPVELVIKY